MMNGQTPLLSIGIIFKNEIRCLERCVKSLDALRQAIPCELVMADTGSDDGSREVAEKYADIFFDFPWINDFAAARNAVMDRCSGKWFMTVDADEWLDEDCIELVESLKSSKTNQYNMCAVIVRSYTTPACSEELGEYNDFLAARIVLMSTGMRYVGAIHEHFEGQNLQIYGLGKTILHHDGYVWFGTEQGKAKQKRNMALLEQELERNPEDLAVLLQCIESSSYDEEQYLSYARRAVEGVEAKWAAWSVVGPPIMRHAVIAAHNMGLPEMDEWITKMKEWFPESMYTRIDINWLLTKNRYLKKEYNEVISRGEDYLNALEDYRVGCYDMASIMFSTLAQTSAAHEYTVRNLLADAYTKKKAYQKAADTLLAIDGQKLDADGVGNYLIILLNIHTQSEIDMSQPISQFWERINAAEKEHRDSLISALLRGTARVFTQDYIESETAGGCLRHGYTAFLSLADRCELGMAAQLLSTTDLEEMAEVLRRVESWRLFSIHALAYALECGVRFPLPDKPLNMEVMDHLTARLAADKESLYALALRAGEQSHRDDWQSICWTRGLLMAAVRAFPWNDVTQDEEQGMAIARAFAKIEQEFLPKCYSEEALLPENLFVLPPLHRFGWYCAQAFAALEKGSGVEYVRLLRQGLEASEGVKAMVEFLVANTEQIQRTLVPPELRALADQVRVILARYAPDDPAVAALKQSAAYQKVAYLIEGAPVPGAGRFVQ